MPQLGALSAVEFDVTDLERSTTFYTDVWSLALVEGADGARSFRASGSDHHVLILRAGETPRIAATDWSVPALSALSDLYERLRDGGYEVLTPIADLGRHGGGRGFSIVDAAGRTWRFTAGVARNNDGAAPPERPHKLSHVVLNSPDVERDVRFAVDMLGFRVRDESRSMVFLGCNADHHSLAFARTPSVTLNHVAFEVPSIDAVMRNAGRLKHAGHPMQWGVGRHGPGANVYSYFLDPDELPIEYTAEIQQVDDATYRVGSPSDWERPPYWDTWGLAEPPTERFRAASAGMRSIPFAAHS